MEKSTSDELSTAAVVSLNYAWQSKVLTSFISVIV
ncbi:hypothetical protein T01_10157 [Trichinella spiralis]|uniref:Uncharacterized protein n=1 Tax=Trichinella spiralis TaxID=6334 RepID=A0A0V0YX17_TRISP|nr:hypothetical protein T01_10157 [Trichinella spiralis]